MWVCHFQILFVTHQLVSREESPLNVGSILTRKCQTSKDVTISNELHYIIIYNGGKTFFRQAQGHFVLTFYVINNE